MKNHVQFYGLKPADKFTVPKSEINWIQHHAMYLGSDQDGVDWIIENDKIAGVRLISASEFFKSSPKINKIEKFYGTPIERRREIETALQRVGKPYSLIDYNCEHFITDVKSGKPVSKQVENAAALGLLGLLLFVVLAD